MTTINLANKFKLELNDKQKAIFSSWAGTCRFIYNLSLEHRVLSWNQYRKSVNYFDQAGELKNLKKVEGFEWIKETPAQCLQQALKDLDKSFKSFWVSGFGFPKYKRRNSDSSFRFPDPKQFRIDRLSKRKAWIVLPKIGKVKVILTRAIEGKIKNATVKQEGENWFISFCLEKEVAIPENNQPGIGIDRGISQTLALSDEKDWSKKELTLPSRVKDLFDKIKELQKRLSKMKRFSQNWRKLKKRIGKIHRRMTRIRHDFLHKVTTRLSKNHGLIVLEDLKIKNMSKSAKGNMENPGKNVKAKSGLNRKILLQGWGILVRMLEYKCRWNGGYLELVAPQFTSQRCPKCLFKHKDNRKGKVFECLNCGHTDDADENAAKNIFTAGRAGSVCGDCRVASVVEAETSLAH